MQNLAKQSQANQILSELVNKYSDVLFKSSSKVRKIPIEFTDKVLELKEAGVSLNEMADSFRVSSKTIRNWIKKNKNEQKTKPKRLYVKSTKNISSYQSQSADESKNNSAFVRLLFKSGVQIELLQNALDYQFLKLINELEQ